MKIVVLLLFLICFSGQALAYDAVLHVGGLVCGYCSQGLKKQFEKSHAFKETKIDLDTQKVYLNFSAKKLSDEELKKIVKEAGYEILGIERFGVAPKKWTAELGSLLKLKRALKSQ